MIAAGLFILLCGIFWAENNISQQFQSCIDEARSHPSTNITANNVAVAVGRLVKSQAVCTARLADTHNGLITALAGIAVAVFTLTLKQSTDRLWNAHNRALETVERAFVFIEEFNVEVTTLAETKIDNLPETLKSVDKDLFVTRFACQPIWRNSGRTPTRKMRIRIDWQSPAGTQMVGHYRNPEEPFFVAPQSISSGKVIEMPGLNALIEDGAAGTRGPIPLMLIWGRADYEDIFGKSHFVEWCYRVRAERHA
jgi:hypothetical protein